MIPLSIFQSGKPQDTPKFPNRNQNPQINPTYPDINKIPKQK